MFIRYFTIFQFIVIFFFHELSFCITAMNSIASNVYNLEIIDSYEFEKDLIFIGRGKIYHINTFVGNIISSNISKHYIEK